MNAYRQSSFAQYEPGVGTLRESGGDYGGTETLVVEDTYQTVPGPLMANSHPGSYTGQDAYSDMLVTGVDCRNGYENEELSGTIQAKENGGQSLNYINPVRCHNVVRRLTPLECERLQGYPDGWTLIGEPEEVEVKDYATILLPGYGCKYKTEYEAFEEWVETAEVDDDGELIGYFNAKDFGFVPRRILVGTHKEIQYFYRDENGKKKCADSPRYKALGNSIALPFWCILAKRISAQYDRDITMGSLFDGIGGFPYAFEKCNGKGAARWASEIEEFPMAVTKLRFGEE